MKWFIDVQGNLPLEQKAWIDSLKQNNSLEGIVVFGKREFDEEVSIYQGRSSTILEPIGEKGEWDSLSEAIQKDEYGWISLCGLSNLATLLAGNPEVIPHLKRIVVVGGSLQNPPTESNLSIQMDPYASQMIFSQYLPLELLVDDTVENWFAYLGHEEEYETKNGNVVIDLHEGRTFGLPVCDIRGGWAAEIRKGKPEVQIVFPK